MKTIRRFALTIFALTLLASIMPSYNVSAQVVPLPRSVEPVFGFVTTDSTDIALLVQFIGTSTANNSGVVAVAAGNITFTQGAQGAEAASTEFECPISLPNGGVIDTTNAACDTVGEVADIINASTNWRAVALDSLRSDSINTRLLAMGATRATSTDGLGLAWSTPLSFRATTAMTPFRSMSNYLVPGTRLLKHNPYDNTRTGLYLGTATSTYGSGSSVLRFFSVKIVPSRSGLTWSEVVTPIYQQAGGATTVAAPYDFRDIGLWGKSGEKVLVRIDNTAAASVITLRTYGLFARAQNALPGRP